MGTSAEQTRRVILVEILESACPVESLRTGKRRAPRKAAATKARGRGEPLPYKSVRGHLKVAATKGRWVSRARVGQRRWRFGLISLGEFVARSPPFAGVS